MTSDALSLLVLAAVLSAIAVVVYLYGYGRPRPWGATLIFPMCVMLWLIAASGEFGQPLRTLTRLLVGLPLPVWWLLVVTRPKRPVGAAAMLLPAIGEWAYFGLVRHDIFLAGLAAGTAFSAALWTLSALQTDRATAPRD